MIDDFTYFEVYIIRFKSIFVAKMCIVFASVHLGVHMSVNLFVRLFD